MNADDFRDYMLSFLFLRYLSGNYCKVCYLSECDLYLVFQNLDLSLKKAHQMPSKKICFQIIWVMLMSI
jgi:hypothetical protein